MPTGKRLESATAMHAASTAPEARDREIPEHGGGTEGAVGASQRTQRGRVAIVPALLGPDQDPRGDRADECDADAEREERDRLDVDRTLDRLPAVGEPRGPEVRLRTAREPCELLWKRCIPAAPSSSCTS